MNVKAYSNYGIELYEDESLDVLVFTNSIVGAEFYITPVEDETRIIGKTLVKAISTVDPSSSILDSEDDESDLKASVVLDRKEIAHNIIGPGEWMIHASSGKSRLSFSKEYFLVIMNIIKNRDERAYDGIINRHSPSRHMIFIRDNGWLGTY